MGFFKSLSLYLWHLSLVSNYSVHTLIVAASSDKSGLLFFPQNACNIMHTLHIVGGSYHLHILLIGVS